MHDVIEWPAPKGAHQPAGLRGHRLADGSALTLRSLREKSQGSHQRTAELPQIPLVPGHYLHHFFEQIALRLIVRNGPPIRQPQSCCGQSTRPDW